MTIYARGVDISEHNGINFDVSEYDFVIIRAAWGTNTDKLFETYVNKCEQAKVPYGVYLYSYALSNEDAEAEAEYALDIAEKYNPFCIFYDMEDADGYKKSHNALSKENCTSFCKIFCDIVSKAKYYTGVYCNPNFLENYVDTTYPIWLAHWGVNPGTTSGAGKYQEQVVMHQYQGDPLDKDVILVDMKTMGMKKETDIPSDFIPEKAKATVIVDAIKIRETPSTKGKDTGVRYKKGESVYYDCKAYKEGYVWISWIGQSGKRRYMAAGEVNSQNKRTKSYCTFRAA